MCADKIETYIGQNWNLYRYLIKEERGTNAAATQASVFMEVPAWWNKR